MSRQSIFSGFRALIFVAAASFSGSAFASSLEFVGRCELSLPLVNISIDRNPLELIACREKEGRSNFYFTQPVSLLLGSQKYIAVSEWQSGAESCSQAIKNFQERPEMYFSDPDVDFKVLVNVDPKFQKIRLTRGSVAICVGKKAD